MNEKSITPSNNKGVHDNT